MDWPLNLILTHTPPHTAIGAESTGHPQRAWACGFDQASTQVSDGFLYFDFRSCPRITEFPLNILGHNWRRVRLEFLLSAADRESFQLFWRQEEAKFVELIRDIYSQGQHSGFFSAQPDPRFLAELFWTSQNALDEELFGCLDAEAHTCRLRERERLFIDDLIVPSFCDVNKDDLKR